MPEQAETVEAYWICQRLSSGDRADRLKSDEHFWAVEAVNDAVSDGPLDAALRLLDALLRAPSSDPALIGAGSLEDLIEDRHAEAATQLAVLGRTEPLWREALGSVWLTDETLAVLPPDLRIYLTSA